MSDDGVGVVLVFFEEIAHSREGYLVDILVDFLFRHADTAVAEGQRFLLLVQRHAHGQVAQFAFEVALLSQRLHLLRGIDGV